LVELRTSLKKVAAANRDNVWPYLALVLVLLATAIGLHLNGRAWWCSSCKGAFWTGDAWSPQTSQLFLDPYSFTHLMHGFMFCGLITLLMRELTFGWRFVLTMAVESAWEVIENSNTVIQRYREATAALGYQGDTVVNSLGDIACCGVGFIVAYRLGWWRSLLMFFAIEAVLLIWIRDSLLLEIIMLIHPVNAIKAWQLG
jgi:hypothetical protein